MFARGNVLCDLAIFVNREQAPAADDDDDMDLFGDETEEEKKAAEERESAKKDTKKPKESKHCLLFGFGSGTHVITEKLHLILFFEFCLGGKSSVLMEVKPWDDETDMKKLEECVRAVEMPGLLWGACKSTISICLYLR